MGYIVSLVCLLLMLWSWKKYKSILNSSFFFCGMWAVICFASQLKLYGFTGASSYVYLIIGIGVLSFFVGSEIGASRTIRGKGEKIEYPNNNCINMRLLWGLMIIVFVYTLSKFCRALPIILQGNSFGYVRMMFFDVGGSIITGAGDYFIYTVIIAGFRLVCEVIIINEVISKRKISMLLSALLVLTLVLTVLLSGGRMVLLDLGTYIFFSIKLNSYKTKWKLDSRQKIGIGVALSIMAVIMICLTMNRQGNQPVIESIYGNFFGGVSLMNTIVHEVLKEKWTFGAMFGYGILAPVCTMLNVVFNIPFPEVFNTYNLIVSPFYNVGKITMNAYTTCFLFFYSDFRVLGVILFSMVFGWLTGNRYNNFVDERSSIGICEYMIMLNVMMYSFVRWQLANSAYILALFLLPFLYQQNPFGSWLRGGESVEREKKYNL